MSTFRQQTREIFEEFEDIKQRAHDLQHTPTMYKSKPYKEFFRTYQKVDPHNLSLAENRKLREEAISLWQDAFDNIFKEIDEIKKRRITIQRKAEECCRQFISGYSELDDTDNENREDRVSAYPDGIPRILKESVFFYSSHPQKFIDKVTENRDRCLAIMDDYLALSEGFEEERKAKKVKKKKAEKKKVTKLKKKKVEEKKLKVERKRKQSEEDAQAQRGHEEKLAKIELMKLTEQRLAAEAARDATVIAKAQEGEQFAAILKSLKDDES